MWWRFVGLRHNQTTKPACEWTPSGRSWKKPSCLWAQHWGYLGYRRQWQQGFPTRPRSRIFSMPLLHSRLQWWIYKQSRLSGARSEITRWCIEGDLRLWVTFLLSPGAKVTNSVTAPNTYFARAPINSVPVSPAALREKEFSYINVSYGK